MRTSLQPNVVCSVEGLLALKLKVRISRSPWALSSQRLADEEVLQTLHMPPCMPYNGPASF
jgi:hypothetical protein